MCDSVEGGCVIEWSVGAAAQACGGRMGVLSLLLALHGHACMLCLTCSAAAALCACVEGCCVQHNTELTTPG